MRKLMLLAVPLVMLFTAGPAQAATIQVGSLAANDMFDWTAQATLPEGVAQNSTVGVTSNTLGRAATLDDGAGGQFTSLIEGTDWLGVFAIGDGVLFTGDASDNNPFSDSFTIKFATLVAGVGTQIQSNNFGLFTASLEVFNGATSLGIFSVAGDNDSTESDTAPFLGILSDAVNIDRAVFTLTANGGAGLGINTLLTTDTPFQNNNAVPEPATLGLVGAGVLAALRRRRQSR